MAVIVLIVVLLAIVVIVAAVLLAGDRGPAADGGEAAASATPIPSGEPLDEALLSDRLTVLVLGVDLNAERESRAEPRNTDAIMLVSLSADQSQLTMIGLPRDTVDLPLADGGTWPDKVNGIEREEGIDTLVGVMEATFEVPIDAHVQIDMDDLVALVDAVGGVKVEVEEALSDPAIGLDLQPGAQELDAETALAFVRTRQDSDYDRADRHQQLLLALGARLVDPATQIDPRAILDSLDSLDTDLPLADLPTLLELARRAQGAAVVREVVRPPELIVAEGDVDDGRGYILQPDIEAIRDRVAELIGE